MPKYQCSISKFYILFLHFSLKIGVFGSFEGSKKALISALLRLMEPTGVVRIDGLNIVDIGLNDLRSKMVVVPQVSKASCLC